MPNLYLTQGQGTTEGESTLLKWLPLWLDVQHAWQNILEIASASRPRRVQKNLGIGNEYISSYFAHILPIMAS